MDIYEYGNPDSSTVLLQMVDDHDLAVIVNFPRFSHSKLSFRNRKANLIFHIGCFAFHHFDYIPDGVFAFGNCIHQFFGLHAVTQAD